MALFFHKKSWHKNSIRTSKTSVVPLLTTIHSIYNLKKRPTFFTILQPYDRHKLCDDQIFGQKKTVFIECRQNVLFLVSFDNNLCYATRKCVIFSFKIRTFGDDTGKTKLVNSIHSSSFHSQTKTEIEIRKSIQVHRNNTTRSPPLVGNSAHIKKQLKLC